MSSHCWCVFSSSVFEVSSLFVLAVGDSASLRLICDSTRLLSSGGLICLFDPFLLYVPFLVLPFFSFPGIDLIECSSLSFLFG